MSSYELLQGDCVEGLRELADGCVDAIITDPPYPEIDRAYGRMTEQAWRAMMDALIVEVRRVLKPRGSAVFVLQPNMEKLGRMRPWLFRFMADVAEQWNLIQDVWWWNFGAMPTGGTQRQNGLLRCSLKACVWAGAPDCYRDQDAVLWTPSASVLALQDRAFKPYRSNGNGDIVDKTKSMQAQKTRGGVTPFNVLPFGNTDSANSGGAWGHPAATPARLCAWWVKYITPVGGLVVDPFSGSGTVALEAVKLGRDAIGIERDPGYHETACKRLAELAPKPDPV